MNAEFVPLRRISLLNPPVPEFDSLPPDAQVTFAPLEVVWADQRLDLSRTRPLAEVRTGYTRFQQDDVLIPKVTPTHQAGRSAIARPLPNGVGAGTTELHVLRAIPGLADPRWLRYAALSKRFLEEGEAAFQGVAGLQRVPGEFVQDFRVADLPVEEQRRIAGFLDDQVTRIDNIIQARQEQARLLGEIHRFDLISAGAALGLEPRSAVPWFPFGGPGWQFLRLSWVTECLDWKRIPLSATERGERAGPYPYYGASAIVDYIDDYLFDEELVLVGEDGAALENPDTDVVQRVSGKVWVNNHAHVLRATGVSPDYLAHILRCVDRPILVSGATRPKITQDDLMSLRIPVPPLPVRDALVTHAQREAREANAAKRDLRDAIGLLEELKRSLITAAVSGEFDVSSADGSGVAV